MRFCLGNRSFIGIQIMKNITIGRRSFFLGAVAAAVSSALPATAAHASGGSSGPHVSFATQGHIGEVIVNPYSIAPLTAIIRNGGYELTEATVRIVPKPQGQEIKYKVSRSELLTHAGIPVFGLYPDWQNTVEVSYTRTFQGKSESSKIPIGFMCRACIQFQPACPIR